MGASSPVSASTPSQPRPSREAAHRASATIASSQQNLPDVADGDLLKESLAPMKDEEREDHKAWVEMESDPAYFSGVLKDLGVADVKIQELFAVTIEEVEQLPQPVYGFVFLCRYEGEDQEDTEEAPQDLWFANQTMANGCATVALINIVMNQPSITLGPTLTAFKAATAPVTPLVRGYRLDSHPLIRQTHNAFARRLEHLNADLCLQNEFDDEGGDPDAAAAKRNSKLKRRQPSTASNASNKRRTALNSNNSNNNNNTTTNNSNAHPPKRRRKRKSDVCHYKAFLFALNQVWVLDGLEENPVSLGPATDSTWLTLALDGIQAKMADAGELVNVLAVCQAPTRRLRAELTTNIAQLKAAHSALPSSAERPPRQPQTLYGDDEEDEAALAPFEISAAELAAEAARVAELAVECEKTTTATIYALEARQTELVMAYNMEVMGTEGEAARCEERKEDFGAAIHAWVEKLAAKRALQALVEDES
ncbi:unnamed protein product [Discula destructiva]